jgi:hypothetical protein
MRKIALLIAAFGATTLLQLCSIPAHAALLPQTWVSHTGNDGNSCSQSSPCLTFAGALAKTTNDGEIDCLDSGNYGPVQITMSVTIDCSGTHAADYSVVGDGIDINAGAPSIVVLRGITISTGAYIGIKITSATTVYIEDCTILGSQPGILDQRSTGFTQLFVKNTVVRSSAGNNTAGILLAAAPKNSVVLENVQSLSNGYGIAVATGNNVVISRSVMSGNKIAGIEADPGALVSVDNTEISHNFSYGVYAAGTVTLANTSSIAGSTISFGNNRLFGNGGGTAPTPAGGTSTDLGQQ